VDAGFFHALAGLEGIECLDDRGAEKLGLAGLVRNEIQTGRTHSESVRAGVALKDLPSAEVQGARPVLEDRVDRLDLLDPLRRLVPRRPQYPDRLGRPCLPSLRPARLARGDLQNIRRPLERQQSR
jgi:hypothetical protein